MGLFNSLRSLSIFLTLSVADLIDPYIFIQIDRSLTFQAARQLSSRRRAELLANNPLAATKMFHRRVQSLFENFLCGQTSPFFEIGAFLGRIEQQARHSPHLHLLIWLKNKFPSFTGDGSADGYQIAKFLEVFCTALLPPDVPIPQEDVPIPDQASPMPVHTPIPAE